jgi:hypothetical protein
MILAVALGVDAFRAPAPRRVAPRLASTAAPAAEPSLPKPTDAVAEANWGGKIAASFVASALMLSVVVPDSPMTAPAPTPRTRAEKRRAYVATQLALRPAEKAAPRAKAAPKAAPARAPKPASKVFPDYAGPSALPAFPRPAPPAAGGLGISATEEEEGVLLGVLPFLALPAAAAGVAYAKFQQITGLKKVLAGEYSPQKRFLKKDPSSL